MDKILNKAEQFVSGLFKDNTTEADKYRFKNPGYKRLVTYEDSEYWKEKHSLIKSPKEVKLHTKKGRKGLKPAVRPSTFPRPA